MRQYREKSGLKSALTDRGFIFSKVPTRKIVDGEEYITYLIINQGQSKAYQSFEKNGDIALIGVYASDYDEMMDNPEAIFSTKDFEDKEIVEFITDDILEETTRGRRGRRIKESAELITRWISEESPELTEGPMTKLYARHQSWAEAQGLKPYGYKTFANIIKNYLSGGGIPQAGIVGGGKVEVIQDEPYDAFEQEIVDNEIYYKFSCFEFTIEQIAKQVPGFSNAYVFGTSGVGKSWTVKNQLEKFRPDYVLKKGGISGYTGLMKVLYDNRKNQMLVLDDCDNLLEPGAQMAHNILKAALDSETGGGPRTVEVFKT